MNRKSIIGFAFVAVLFASAAVMAIVTFDPISGTGFVGKGDVQLVFGWNNKALQDNAGSVQFQASSASLTTSTWTCDRDAGPQTQERHHSTTTTTAGVISSIGRERNQITGFILSGYSDEVTTTTEHEGPQLLSCPTGWTAIDLVEVTVPVGGGGLQVSINGTDWSALN